MRRITGAENREEVNRIMGQHGAGIRTIEELVSPIDQTVAAYFQWDPSRGKVGAFGQPGQERGQVLQQGGSYALRQTGLEGFFGLEIPYSLAEAAQQAHPMRTNIPDIVEAIGAVGVDRARSLLQRLSRLCPT
jgi:hypothetical protein